MGGCRADGSAEKRGLERIDGDAGAEAEQGVGAK
ncbi:hypothetical protein SAMN04488689_103679 [Paenibacillus sp. cl6col]|nr:hypothetical protein SAMN04488689_103679 [Paenibacillus sp. cl6col]